MAIKEFFVKLVSWQQQRKNVAEMQFRSAQNTEHELAREREQLARQKVEESKWEEVKIPTEAEITGPSESSPEKKD